MPLKEQSLCIGDLMRYYGESKYKMKESIEKITENRGIASKLLNTIREHTETGVTLDGLITQLQIASGTDIFTFKINGVDPTKVFTDEKNVELDVYMNPIYFNTKGAISSQLPGFRHKHISSEKELVAKGRQEQQKWLRWFEKELRGYHNNWKRKCIEE